LRRALCRASGQEPPSRGKKWKSRNIKNENDSEIAENVEQIKVEANLDDNLRFVTQFIDKKTDIDRLIDQHFSDRNVNESSLAPKNARRFGIVGLHTCGPLASSSIRIFLAKDGGRFEFISVVSNFHVIPKY
jgi:hypothetical protein